MDNKEKVLIIGGGIFGLSTAIVLGEKGYQVNLFRPKEFFNRQYLCRSIETEPIIIG